MFGVLDSLVVLLVNARGEREEGQQEEHHDADLVVVVGATTRTLSICCSW